MWLLGALPFTSHIYCPGETELQTLQVCIRWTFCCDKHLSQMTLRRNEQFWLSVWEASGKCVTDDTHIMVAQKQGDRKELGTRFIFWRHMPSDSLYQLDTLFYSSTASYSLFKIKPIDGLTHQWKLSLLESPHLTTTGRRTKYSIHNSIRDRIISNL